MAAWRDYPRNPPSRWACALIIAVALLASMWTSEAEAATVVGELELLFEGGERVTTIVEVPLEPADIAQDALSAPLLLWALEPDVWVLVGQLGPVLDLSWSVRIEPTVIPLPGSGVALASAMGVFWLVARRRV